MVDVEQAEEILRRHPFKPQIESVTINASVGRVLAQSMVADRDFPPFDRVMMDGIAICHERLAAGDRRFPVEATVGAGSNPATSFSEAGCVEIMTGAALPAPYDTVIRYEDVRISDGYAEVLVDAVVKGKSIHWQGSDKRAGDIIATAGRLIDPALIGIAASTGYAQLDAWSWPKIAAIATGDELVPVEQTPNAYQIRSSNEHVIEAAFAQLRVPVDRMHVNDNQDEVENLLKTCLEDYEVLLFLGGTSKGKYDYVPEILGKYGIDQHFHGVKQRPGKPLLFGSKGDSIFVFALPGNPVSAFMCLQRYVIRWLKNSLGLDASRSLATLQEQVKFNPPLTYYLQVECKVEDGRLWASPQEGRGSGDLANLTKSNAFMQLPAGRDVFEKDEQFPIIPFKPILS
ncbi:MAG: molybdopterin molybdotransferase MoeA [Saprospiraceae bacterium]|nr:molybdopterin molybdotransferase MoeA [Saprospiraceae bacterium]